MLSDLRVEKRNGVLEEFDADRIVQAIYKAIEASKNPSINGNGKDVATRVAQRVVRMILEESKLGRDQDQVDENTFTIISVEHIQDRVETVLIEEELRDVAKVYMTYRDEHQRLRSGARDEDAQRFAEARELLQTDLQMFQHLDKYARYREEDQRRESWPETVDRVIGFIKNFIHNGHGVQCEEKDWTRLRDAMLRLEALPAMRMVQMAGPAAAREHMATFNCAYAATRSLQDFDESLYILMQGTGSAFGVESNDVEDLSKIRKQRKPSKDTFTVPDMTEGWCQALRIGLERWYDGSDIRFDYSKIRRAGAKLKTKGGVSSGPGPLRRLLEFTRKTVLSRQGRRLLPIHAHDIHCMIGEAVEVGGVRRCLPKGTIVHTSRGGIPIEEIRVGDTVETLGEKAPVIAAFDQGIQETIFVEHLFGRLECTPNHRLAVFTSLEEWEFKPASEILPGDRLVWDPIGYEGSIQQLPHYDYLELVLDDGIKKPMTRRGGKRRKATGEPCAAPGCNDPAEVGLKGFCEAHYFRNRVYGNPLAKRNRARPIRIPDLNEDVAWLIGFLHGDGYIRGRKSRSDSSAKISVPIPRSEPELGSRVTRIMRNEFGMKAPGVVDYENYYVLRFPGKELSSYFLTHFKRPRESLSVPSCVRNSTREVRAAYIAGLLDADGTPTNRPLVVASSIYKDYLNEVRTLMASLGIASYVVMRRPEKGNWKPLYHLCVKGMENRDSFDSLVGRHSIRLGAHELAFSQGGFSFTNEMTVACGMPTLANSNQTTRWLSEKRGLEFKAYPVEVLGISEGRRVQTYDIEVETLHRFTAEGFVVHNSARLSLSDLDDPTMRDAKSGSSWFTTAPFRTNANNSAVYEEKPDAVTFMEEWLALAKSGSGERGIFNRWGLQYQLPKRRRLTDGLGCNPCAEVILRKSGQTCNLSLAVIRPGDIEADIMRKVELATIFGTLQSCFTRFSYLRPIWRENSEDERLLGVDLAGASDNLLLRPENPDQAKLLERLRKHAIRVNRRWSEILDINPSAAVTCNKPGGNSGVFLRAGHAVTGWPFHFMKRHVTVGANTAMARFLMDQGIPHWPKPGEPDPQNPSRWLFAFPLAAPEGAMVQEELSAIEQLENWKTFKVNWTEHNPSVTCVIGPDEWIEAGHWVYENFEIVSGLSFLPRQDHIYEFAPFQRMDEQEFREFERGFPQIDWSKFLRYETADETNIHTELACVAGACSV